MRASIIGARYDCTRRRSRSTLHSGSNPIWMLQRDGADCRATPTEEGAKRAGLFGRGDDVRKKWHQLCAEWLMQMIGKDAA